MKGFYSYPKKKTWLKDCKYGPCATDGHNFLCPHCGGHGYDSKGICLFCDGVGYIDADDPRLYNSNKNKCI